MHSIRNCVNDGEMAKERRNSDSNGEWYKLGARYEGASGRDTCKRAKAVGDTRPETRRKDHRLCANNLAYGDELG